MTPFDIKNIIDQKTQIPFWDDGMEKDYIPFVINRAYSFNQQGIWFAAELNKYSFLSKKQQFEFYYHGLPKGKRFDKWIKQDEIHHDIKMLQQYYDINNREAEAMLRTLTSEQLNELRSITSKGGRK